MKKVAILLLTIGIFVVINLFLYISVSGRLANNFSGSNQLKMIDVSRYLPFEEGSDLARTGSSFRLEAGDDLPVLDGAAALVPVYASVIENCYPEGSVTYEGGTFSDENYYGENFADNSVMQYQNTVRGFDAVVDGTVDVFFTAHPSEEQMLSAKEKGVELEIVPIGMESFVFIVNKANPVDDLSVEQIRSIYRGEITNWNEVGGPSKLINQVTRVEGSGSQTMMEKFMEGNMLKARKPLAIFGGSIGYSFRYYVSGVVKDDNVKMLKVNGIYPSVENIKNGSYPISTNFYIVYRKDNANSNVPKLVDWLLSDEGQTMIEECGYVGLSD